MVKRILERLLSRPIATGLSKGDLDAIKTVLARLNLQEKYLGAAAYDYVLKGSNDGVLLQIANAQKGAASIAGYLGHPDSSTAAKRSFLGLEGWDAPVVRRLGEVLAATAKTGWYARYLPGTAASPEFFRALAHITATCLDHTPDPEATWLLDGSRCLELLSLEGADQGALVDVLFARLELGKWGRQGQARLLTMKHLPEALAAAPDRTLFGARALDMKGRCRFLEFLGRVGLASRGEFFDALLEAIVNGGKQQTEAALASLTSCEEGQVREGAARLLASDQVDERRSAVLVLANAGTPGARSLLEEHATREKSSKVREQIEETLRSLRAVGNSTSIDSESAGNGYVSIDGDWIAVPAAPALPADSPPPDGMRDELRAAVHEANREARRLFVEFEQRHAQLSPEEQKRHYGPKVYADPFSADAIPEFMNVVVGRADPRGVSGDARHLGAGWHGYYRSAAEQYHKKLEAILSHPEVTSHHLARILALYVAPRGDWAHGLLSDFPSGAPARRLLLNTANGEADFRPVLQACLPIGGGPERFLSDILSQRWGNFYSEQIEAHRGALWPVVVEQTDIIDQALGLAPAPPESAYQVIRALELLAILPAPPGRYLQILLDISVSGHKDEKAVARTILSSTRSVTGLILPLLDSGERNRRMAAADWLRERRAREAIPRVRAALAREKTDLARAAFLNTLTALGDDVSDQFSEQRLLREAKTGLSKTKTKVGACLPLDFLPVLAWADGRQVPPEVVRWWVVLADKLKSARGNPMLNFALDRLEQGCAEQLATFAMSSFVAYDTRRPTEEEANAYAEANADQLVQTYRRWQSNFSRERAFAQLKNQKLGQYFQSAIDRRGILGLARRAPASEAVNIVKAYFRDHYARTQQCKALLDCLANNPSPIALQFVLGISMRYRTAGVQKHAATLVNTVAAERGWTRDELADRTAPTGGLDEAGALELQSGESIYVANLDADLKVVLRNPEGKVVQALPSGSGETASSAKKAFSNLKKELKQTVQQQTARLYEAMCAGRVWPSEDIDAFLFRHPIVGRLCQRLIFAGVSPEGKLVETFRPLGDGSLTNVADESVGIATFSGVRIAHRALLDESQAKAWQQHLMDYEILPLFEQFARPLVSLDRKQADATAIKEREGYMLDTFTLRGVANKLGYQRGQGEDGGIFTTYQKSFPAADCVALIEFTGCQLPETNIPCALIGLSFNRYGGGSTRYRDALVCSAGGAIKRNMERPADHSRCGFWLRSGLAKESAVVTDGRS